MIGDEMPFLINKLTVLTDHLSCGDKQRTLQYVLECVGNEIDDRAKKVTKGIVEGINLQDLMKMCAIINIELEKSQPKKKNVGSRKASR